MSEDDKKKALIAVIAEKNNILLNDNDPIMMLLTANDFLMKENVKELSEALDQHRSQLEIVFNTWGKESTETAQKLLNASLSASKLAMSQLLDDSSQLAVKAIEEKILAAKKIMDAQESQSRQLSYLNIAAAGITLFAVCLLIFFKL